MMKFQILWRILMKLPRMKQTELSQLLKKIKLEEVTGSCYFILWLLFKILFMDLIKSRSLIFLSPSPLDTAALFSFCLYTIHLLQLIKLKKPGNKVWNKVNKVLCLGMPGWLSRLSICLRLRSWSWSPGIESHIGLPAQRGGLLLPLTLFPLVLFVSHSLSLK